MGSTPPERASPYLGLTPYGEEDAELFFGRSAQRELVIANLLTSRLTVMYGPSGVGKSSLLHAGVATRLRDGVGVPRRGSARTVALVDAWQGDPAQAILSAVAAADGGEDGDAGDVPFDEALAQYGRRSNRILLLILDQFEEYFLYHGGRDDGLRQQLLLALSRADIRVRALICVREDALAKLDTLEGSASALFGNLLRLGPMSDAAALEAIKRPADHDERVTLEPGLPEQVLQLLHEREPSAGAARGVLAGESEGIEPSYLQLVMRRLWEREARNGSPVLRTETLRSMGGLREIVGEHLAEAMDQLTLG